MIDLSEIVNDPDLGQPFTITRTTGEFAAGGWQADAPTLIPAFGVITVASDEALQQVPEGDRVAGSMMVFTQTPIYQTLVNQSGISDTLVWRGNTYRVQAAGPWEDYGYYQAIIARMTGA